MGRDEKVTDPGRRASRSSERPYGRQGADRQRAGRQGADRRRQPTQSLSEEIMGLDTELLRILTQRSILMNKLRKGKAHASTPGIIKSEKQIRSAWEQQAGRLSSSPRLSRQLFGLINELEIQPERDGEAYSPFNLSPSRQPVNVNVPGPVSTMLTQLWLALAVSSGRHTRLVGAPRSAPMLDIVRAFEQIGVRMAWAEDDLELDGNKLPDYHGKAIFLGDDLLTFYIFTFLGLTQPGKLRFTGGASLKEADLGALGRFLPKLGARLVNVMPGGKGLPVNLECSGELPDELTIPAELPLEAALALLLSALTWKKRISISLEEQPPARKHYIIDLAKRAFQILPGLGQALESSIDYDGYSVADLDFPAEVRAPIDPVISATALALPLFTGGRVELSGKWVNLYQANELINLLKKIGLEIRADDLAVSSAPLPDTTWPETLELDELSVHFHPLFWVLNARLAGRAKGPVLIRRWPAGADLDLAEDFMTQIGYKLERTSDGLALSQLDQAEFKEAASKTYGWPCPNFIWGLAMSLGAFMRSNLKISNPDCVSRVVPDYWHFYNRLPSPRLRKAGELAETAKSEKTARRRIRTDAIAEPEPREDFEE